MDKGRAAHTALYDDAESMWRQWVLKQERGMNARARGFPPWTPKCTKKSMLHSIPTYTDKTRASVTREKRTPRLASSRVATACGLYRWSLLVKEIVLVETNNVEELRGRLGSL